MQVCYCDSQKPFNECCEPILNKSQKPKAAIDLLRARYSAFVVGNIDFVKETTHPDKLDDFDEKEVSDWSKNSDWQGLKIHKIDEGKPAKNQTLIEFEAFYKNENNEFNHHERAAFQKEKDQWYFVDGFLVQKPVVNEKGRPGRNDPCVCGSGKKFKKCCG